MRVSVILATYNAPRWLEKVIWGYAAQSAAPMEIVVADDGSNHETADAIRSLHHATGLCIKHVWHEDRGFRKCEILNKAVTAASGEYLVISDGDCIPRADFLAAHQRFAAPGRFLSGGLVRLPMPLSERITRDDIMCGQAFSAPWLIRGGLPLSKKCLMVASPPSLGAVMDRITTTRATWNGHNASGWKADILRVNGFDERMGYGGEDRELGERLMNAGIRPKQIRHRAICLHLDHQRGYVDQQVIAWNIRHRERVRAEKVRWTEYGIEKRAAAAA